MNRTSDFLASQRASARFVLGLVALATLGALPVQPASAATRTVTTCVDGGVGSLRDAARLAVSGDSIDMTRLACGRILLSRGAITLPQNDLVLLGPGRLALTIDGGNLGRVFDHAGTGTLRLYRLSVANGRYANVSATGGCINSNGSVELIRSRVHRCEAIPCCALEPGNAGGGIYARGRVLLSESSVFYSKAIGGAGGGVAGGDVTLYRSQVYNNEGGEGGGVSASRSLSVTYSLVHNNRGSDGGGLSGRGTTRMVVNKSTISNNWASGFGGGIQGGGSEETWIINSTISGNSGYYTGGMYALPYTFIVGSTIAFNETRRPDECQGALSILRDSLLVSSIVAQNTCPTGQPVDVDVFDAFGTGALSGGHNLIGFAEGPVPGDTIFGNPMLGPLADNGGPTRTHMPASNSLAIDRGSNLLAQQFDQRGPDFFRVKGGLPDIGAVER